MRRLLLCTALSISLLCPVGIALPGVSAPAKPQVVEVFLREFEILPKEIAAKPGAITFLVKNLGVIEHDFVVEDGNGKAVAKIAVISPGKQDEVQAVIKPGLYSVFCSLPGHKEAGMKGLLKVQD